MFWAIETQQFVSEEKDWADQDDSEDEAEYVNLALMAKDDQKEATTSSTSVSSNNSSPKIKDGFKSYTEALNNELSNLKNFS